MKIFAKGKDGGPASTVTGYWLIEWKRLFSVVLLKFEGRSREAFHTHAFNSVSWLFKGQLWEELYTGRSDYFRINKYKPSPLPIITNRNTNHKVDSVGTSWALSFRGPWALTWQDMECNKEPRTLTWGRKEV